MLNVLRDRGYGGTARCRNECRVGPERGDARPQGRVFLPQMMRRTPFDQTDEPCDAKRWVASDYHMHMVGPGLNRVQCTPRFLNDACHDLCQSRTYLIREKRATVLDAP